jgi:integrase
MRIISEFAATGRHHLRERSTPVPLPDFMEFALAGVVGFAEKELHWAQSTITQRIYWTRRFLRFLLSLRPITTWHDLMPDDLSAYIESLFAFRRDGRSAAHYSIKAILRILFVQELLPVPLHERTPRFHSPRDAVLPTIWQSSEIDALLAVVDRSTASGKRDYAILLFALRLGLRVCDIRSLCLDDLQWERSRIEIVQQKTGKSLLLPLLPEIGEAIIDYLRHARPSVAFREVFLRHDAPFTPFPAGANFYNQLQRYRRKANLPPKPRTGMHSLRHTMATRMLQGGTSLVEIASILGHTSVDATRRYLRVDLDSLRQVALDPDEETSDA